MILFAVTILFDSLTYCLGLRMCTTLCAADRLSELNITNLYL